MPKHVSNIIEISPEESVVTAIPAYDFQTEKNVVIVTKNGMVKRSKLKEFKLQRYSKATSCMNLKDDDQVIDAFIEDKKNLFLVTDSGYGLAFPTEEVPIVGVKAAGVKGMKLKDDYLVSANMFDFNQDEYITVITDKGTAKRVRLNEFELLSRARRGLQIVREVKTNPYKVLKTFVVDNKEFIGIKNDDIKTMKLTELPIADRYSTGSLISKHQLTDAFVVANLTKATQEELPLVEVEEIEVLEEEPTPSKKDKVSLKEIDDRLMTIDDFLN
jgi:topoisomerase-4 subunit A